MKVLSFGGGVNSMAILCMVEKGELNVDAVIFADTGCEMPETYDYIEKVVKPLCRKINLPFHTVTNGNLYEDNWKRKIIPYRMFRSCTDNFKVRPIKRFVKETYGPTEMLLGIDAGESHRTNGMKGTFPLIEMGIDRNGCKEIIKAAGYHEPIKSCCFFCPFTKFENWKWLLKKHPDLFEKAIRLEENGQGYPEYTLTEKPLRKIRVAIESQRTLCLNTEGACIWCHA